MSKNRKRHNGRTSKREVHQRPGIAQPGLLIPAVSIEAMGLSTQEKMARQISRQGGKLYESDIHRMVRGYLQVIPLMYKELERLLKDGVVIRGIEVDSHGNRRGYFKFLKQD